MKIEEVFIENNRRSFHGRESIELLNYLRLLIEYLPIMNLALSDPHWQLWGMIDRFYTITHCLGLVTFQEIRNGVFYPSALCAGGVLSYQSRWVGGWLPDFVECISLKLLNRFSLGQSSMALSRPEVVQHCGHLPNGFIWAYPWAKIFSNLAPVGFRLWGMHISETAGQIYSKQSSMELTRLVKQRHSNLPICPIWGMILTSDFQGQIVKFLGCQ